MYHRILQNRIQRKIIKILTSDIIQGFKKLFQSSKYELAYTVSRVSCYAPARVGKAETREDRRRQLAGFLT